MDTMDRERDSPLRLLCLTSPPPPSLTNDEPAVRHVVGDVVALRVARATRRRRRVPRFERVPVYVGRRDERAKQQAGRQQRSCHQGCCILMCANPRPLTSV